MARARKKKAKTARKRAATKRTPSRKTVAKESQSNWQIGAGILALAIILGASAYFVAMNDGARTTVAGIVDQIEVPQAVKEFPDKVKQSLPEMPSLTNSSADAAKPESVPAR